MFKTLLPKIMTEAHARARDDFAWVRANNASDLKPYSYYLGLQMRSGYAEARSMIGATVNGFRIVEPRHVWA